MMPVVTANTAASAGSPPIFSAMPIAIGAVTDFGTSECTVAAEAPNPCAIATTLTSATVEPATSAPAMGMARRRTLPHSRTSGTARPTTAGPSRKCTNCAPSK